MNTTQRAAARVIDAWDSTVLPVANDGRLQEAMEDLRAVLEAAMADTPTLREAAQQALEALEHATTIIDGAIYCGHELNEAGIKKRAAINFRINALRAALAEQAAEQARPDIIERLTYHALERDDLTLDDCLAYLAEGWKRVRGRTERQMVLQLTALLAGAPAAERSSEAYDKIDRFLRNNLDDADYAEFSAALDAMCSAPAAEQAEPVAVPAGYALVPVEPTAEMCAAPKAETWVGSDYCERIYRAMIAAAPPAPARQEPLTVTRQLEAVGRVAEVHMSRYTVEWLDRPYPSGTVLYADIIEAAMNGPRRRREQHALPAAPITAAPAEGGAA